MNTTNQLKSILTDFPNDVMGRLLVGQATDGDQMLAANIISLALNAMDNTIEDEIASRYHPEFGTEWREPDGSLYKIVKSAELRAMNEVKKEVCRLFERYNTPSYNKNSMGLIIIDYINHMIAMKHEGKDKE